MPNDILKIIADNPKLFETLRDMLVNKFTTDPELLAKLDNTELGQVVRANITGISKVGEVFRMIEAYRSSSDGVLPDNPAR